MGVDLEPVKGLQGRWREYVDLANTGDCLSGSFSRVLVLEDAVTVVELTCCPATQVLLNDLAKRSNLAPLGLPVVFEAAGLVATEGPAKYAGYEIERLERLDDESLSEYLALVEKAALQSRSEYYASDPRAALRLARRLSKESEWGTASAWEFIAKTVRRIGCVVDRMNADNLLVRRNGQICIADPVGPSDELLAPLNDSVNRL